MNKPDLQNLLDFAREDDTVYVKDFRRLAHSTKDLLELVDIFTEKNMHLVSLKENLDTSTATGNLMLAIIVTINQIECENIMERQRDRIALAKARGAYKWLKAVQVKDFGKYYDRYLRREYIKKELADELNISRPKLDRLIKEYQQSEK